MAHFLDANGVGYLWNKLSLNDYPNNETLSSVINAIDDTKLNKSDLASSLDTLFTPVLLAEKQRDTTGTLETFTLTTEHRISEYVLLYFRVVSIYGTYTMGSTMIPTALFKDSKMAFELNLINDQESKYVANIQYVDDNSVKGKMNNNAQKIQLYGLIRL